MEYIFVLSARLVGGSTFVYFLGPDIRTLLDYFGQLQKEENASFDCCELFKNNHSNPVITFDSSEYMTYEFLSSRLEMLTE